MSKLNDRTDWSCMHMSYDIDIHLRTVCCSKCGAELDAFDTLRDLSRRSGYLEMMEADAKKTAQRVAYLKGEELKIKARVKNASRKDADVAVQAERDRNADNFSKARWNLRNAEGLVGKALKQLGETVSKKERGSSPTDYLGPVNLPLDPGSQEEETG